MAEENSVLLPDCEQKNVSLGNIHLNNRDMETDYYMKVM